MLSIQSHSLTLTLHWHHMPRGVTYIQSYWLILNLFCSALSICKVSIKFLIKYKCNCKWTWLFQFCPELTTDTSVTTLSIFSAPAQAIAIPPASVGVCMQNVRANVKVMEFQPLCIFFLHFNFAYYTNKAPYNKSSRQVRIPWLWYSWYLFDSARGGSQVVSSTSVAPQQATVVVSQDFTRLLTTVHGAPTLLTAQNLQRQISQG